jgi:hypothetical protein
MANEAEPIAKRQENGQIEWTCPVCGGWDRLCQVYYSFLPFIDHLIRDLCVLQHPMLKNPRIINGEVWYRIPGTTRLLPGLSSYDPNSPDWKELLGGKLKIHSQAKLFLPDIGSWLEIALVSLEELNDIRTSDIFTADLLLSHVGKLEERFKEQREYLLKYKNGLEQTGTDPKWLAKPGNQARFIANSMAGARWGLTTSSSREMIRAANLVEREEAFKILKIPLRESWWFPQQPKDLSEADQGNINSA